MERKGTHLEGFTIPSASCRTVVYKGLFTASKIDQFYWDLRDPRFETSYAIFHQRYSTNTFPSWSIAQPFRSVAHNGEINTIRSNRAWMVGREVNATSQVWGERIGELRPFLEPEQSDSGSLDNAFELLLRTGRSLAHVKEMLLPAAWENLPDLDPRAARLLRVPRLSHRAVGWAGCDRRHRRQDPAGRHGPQRTATGPVGDHPRRGAGRI